VNGNPPQISGDAFIVIVERLARIETALDQIRRDRDDLAKERDDFETRLRGVERWRYAIPPTLVTALVSMAVAIYSKLGK
jgi:hypothetical protein